ncbi:MAG: carboxypeptidase-like regulatory domain-containing protein [Bacteroidetes Order II. Incertae sedis bacterium]|nr:carboxypeptidase-like regulatory domain-containing protein [Bacteroidetes Order II. bacterium]MBT4052828.1 carboxypeptidase-like regulatory domain-containing protein [Bacteroidetes Order II. bacterium]MBT4602556.1 carboxypeptidase-like regulatory domain-containing protein [Bacteroidetes Order II. bacterium]MBT6199503.1 carboxypeptidase-like regulatory domain-containing protein [Bacteroidetes Order II. bacterium]MBT6598807.1 carboxypeptidase-like regulatory domain-containing protein [Bacteroi
MHKRLIFSISLTFCLFCTPDVYGQQIARARLLGTVQDAASGEALQGVHIFISRSSIGAVSDSEGAFRLMIPLGAHRIVVSRVGHQTQTHDVMIRAPKSYKLDFDLVEEVMVLGELSISDKRDEHWDDYLKQFREAFLGMTDNAKEVEILNPEILDLMKDDGTLIASAEEPLILNNRALGYRIEHHLHQFVIDGDETWQDGESYFREMTPSSEQEAEKWDKHRKKAYNGSAQHFFRSMMDNRTRKEGFQVFHVDDPDEVGDRRQYETNSAAPFQEPQFAVNPFTFLEPGNTDQDYTLDFSNYFMIVYTHEEEDRRYAEWQRVYHSGQVRDMQYSWLRLQNGATTLDSRGNVLDPYAVAYFGYMSFERLADLLPKEYDTK